MRKLLSLLLCLAALTGLAACGGGEEPAPQGGGESPAAESPAPEAEPPESDPPEIVRATPTPEPAKLEPGEVNTVEGEAEYTLVNVYATGDVMPPKPSSVYTHYEAESGMTYVVYVLDVKNLRENSVDAEDLLDTQLTIGGSSYFANCLVESDEGADFDYGSSTDVAALSTARLHYLFQVPADSDTEDMDFTVTCGGDRRSAQLGLSQFESQLQTVTLGQTITDDETLSLTVDSISFANTLYPPRPASYYHYYEAPSGKTYLIVKMTVTNLKGTDMKYDTIAGVSCVYNGKYNYNSFAAVETDGGGDLSGYPGQNSIAPLDTGVVYYLMEVPAEVEGGPVEVTFYIAGEYYTYSIG